MARLKAERGECTAARGGRPGGPGGSRGLAGVLSIEGTLEVCGFTSTAELFTLRDLF